MWKGGTTTTESALDQVRIGGFDIKPIDNVMSLEFLLDGTQSFEDIGFVNSTESANDVWTAYSGIRANGGRLSYFCLTRPLLFWSRLFNGGKK